MKFKRQLLYYIIFVITFFLIFISSGLCSQSALATASVTIKGGNLSISATDIKFYPIDLTLNQNSSFGQNIITIKDPTGSGAGWHVNARATDLVSRQKKCLSLNEVSFTVLSISKDQITRVMGSKKTPQGVGHTVRLSGSDQKIFFASTKAGMGIFKIRPKYQLTVPKHASSGDYTSNVTYTIFQGP